MRQSSVQVAHVFSLLHMEALLQRLPYKGSYTDAPMVFPLRRLLYGGSYVETLVL